MPLAAALAALVPASARAFDLDLRIQAQAAALSSISLPDPRFGVAEVQVNASIYGFGAATGLAFERFPTADGETALGGTWHLAFQWRFVAIADRHLYEWFDPHIDLGFVLGGARAGGGSLFRGAGYGGLGIDVRILPWEEHAVLTVQYRWSPTGVHAPETAPDHLLFFGIGLRYAEN